MRFGPRLADGVTRRLLPRLVNWVNRGGSSFVTLHRRPKHTGDIGTWHDPDVRFDDIAVVMQGPVMSDERFTLETLRLYLRHMPDCRLILSTWSDTPAADLDPIRDLGVEMVLSEKPSVPGPFNVNMQIVSTSAGVRAAVAAGAAWILKTRTDQRLGDRNSLAFLRSLARIFPPAAGTGQSARIIGVGQGSMKFAPYHVTDQTIFGAAADMLIYWTPPLRETPLPEHWPGTAAEMFVKMPIDELCRGPAAESYICTQFLQRLGHEPDWSLRDSWTAYRDRFCFADHPLTDFFWVKGQMISQSEHTRRYDAVSNRYDMGFGEWLLLYDGTVAAESATQYDDVLQQRFNAKVPPPSERARCE